MAGFGLYLMITQLQSGAPKNFWLVEGKNAKKDTFYEVAT